MTTRRLVQSINSDPRLVEFVNENFIPIRLDVDKEPALIEALGIQCYPTMILAEPAGKILLVRPGSQGPEELGKHLRMVLKRNGNL